MATSQQWLNHLIVYGHVCYSYGQIKDIVGILRITKIQNAKHLIFSILSCCLLAYNKVLLINISMNDTWFEER